MELLIEQLKKGNIPEHVKKSADTEQIALRELKERIINGTVVLPRSLRSPVTDDNLSAIGKGMRTKVNANIGTSPDQADISLELEKLHIAVESGADAVMDLSTGGDLRKIRQVIRKACTVPLGTVPIYQAICELVKADKQTGDLTADHLFDVIEQHAEDGVDFVTVHCGITLRTIKRLHMSNRIAGVVSRGGSFLVKWMDKHNQENPLYAQFDRLLDIARRYDVTLSLGDGLRPGAIADASDLAQYAELNVLGELVTRARKAFVQVIVEGPGHVPIDQINANMHMQKTICSGAPFYVLGPLVTDVAAGYDHITSAIGGALAASAGADFLCYVTPSEHIHLPGAEDVRLGVMASRIAAHAGDLVKKIPGAWEWDAVMSKARKALDWEAQKNLALDPKKFAHLRNSHKPGKSDVCTMCGEFCAMDEIKDEVKV
ncbi:MAG: phosphomethylpyrimidine synthase ThiC [bacterium]